MSEPEANSPPPQEEETVDQTNKSNTEQGDAVENTTKAVDNGDAVEGGEDAAPIAQDTDSAGKESQASSAPVVPPLPTKSIKPNLSFISETSSGVDESDLALINSALKSKGVAGDGRNEDGSYPQSQWSRIGCPGFSYERFTDPKAIGTKGTYPQTVRYSRIGTPRYSLTRREGNSVDLTAVTIPLQAALEAIETSLDLAEYDADLVEEHVDTLEKKLSNYESALYISQPGRVFFVQLRGFIKEMRRLIRDLDDEEMYPDISDDEVAVRIEVALRNSQRLRAVTSALPLDRLRSYKDPLPNRTIKTAR